MQQQQTKMPTAVAQSDGLAAPQKTTTKASPWKTTSTAPQPVSSQQPKESGREKAKGSLLDIMSEQLAQSLETKDVRTQFDVDEVPQEFFYKQNEQLILVATTADSAPVLDQGELDLDMALAAQLQEEEDALLYQQNRHGPKGNVTINYYHEQKKFYLAQELQRRKEMEFGEDYAGDDGYQVEESEPKRRTPPWPVRDKSLKGQGGEAEIITKHDPEINGLKNARKLESTVVNCGPLGDTIVPNRIYNSFQARMKRIAHSEKGVSSRTVEDDSTRSKTLDAKTRLVLHRLLDAGVLDAVNYVVRTGKEGVIFHAIGPAIYKRARPGKAPFPARTPSKGDDFGEEDEIEDEDEEDEDELAPEDLLSDRGDNVDDTVETLEFAVKVYKTSLTEFANRREYIEGDHRFAALGQLSRQNKRKIVKVWAEKELKNMTRIFRAGIPCPEPIRLDTNVLIMSFIGEDGWGAPQLADLDLGSSHSKAAKCFVQVFLLARALWDRCKLVHADLSEFNVLYLKGQCYVVDVGQAVERQHPHAKELLTRDVFNVLTFFYNKCKRTGCGGGDEQVQQIVDLIVNGTPEPDLDVDGEDWAVYAKELGPWADFRVAYKLGELL